MSLNWREGEGGRERMRETGRERRSAGETWLHSIQFCQGASVSNTGALAHLNLPFILNVISYTCIEQVKTSHGVRGLSAMFTHTANNPVT